MNYYLAILCSLQLLPTPSFAVEITSNSISQPRVENSSCDIKADNGDTGEYSEKQLQTLANRITVRVIGDNNGGSGTLVAKRGNTYIVLSNSHVVRGVNSISLQTSDGKNYPAQIVTNTNFEKFDLALLQFQSNQNYCLPKEIATSIPNTDTPVLAAGYSTQKGEVIFRPGKVQQISERPLKEGYQIGYTSDIEQGMSGGAIINSRGELIGINGRSAYPILNTGYVYSDGSRPTELEIKQMRSVSWGIPVFTVLAQVNNDILTAYSLPLPQTRDRLSEVKLTGWLGELEQKAKQITVRIDSSGGGNGSGIIIAKNGDTYTVLTAAHVVCEREDATKPCGDYKYQILAPDGKQYPVEKSTIKTESGVDLAVVKFTAAHQNYQVATLANYNFNGYNFVFTAGYPAQGNNSPWRLTMGLIFNKEQDLSNIKEVGLFTLRGSELKINSGSLQTTSSLTGGYELVYTNITYGGMSGGPVLDSLGRVIGIHGRAEGERAIDEKTEDSGSSRGQVQLGFSLGIRMNTFLGLATRLGVQAQKVETTAAPQPNDQQSKSIQKIILSTDISKGNTTASQWLERGNQLWRLGRYQEAVKAFDEAIKQKPSFIYLAYYGKGLALSWDGKLQEAEAALDSATNYKPDLVTAWLNLSTVYQRLDQLDKALVAIDKAIQLQPKNPNLYNQKWEVLKDLEKYAEAEAAINKAIELNPRSVFYNNRGHFYLYGKKRRLELALADFNKAIVINPQDFLAYLFRGIVYSQQKTFEKALADYNKAIAINSQFISAYRFRALAHFEKREKQKAIQDLQQLARILQAQGNTATYKWIINIINKVQGYTTEELINISNLFPELEIVTVEEKRLDFYINRGNIYFEHKKWDLALADYNKAIAISPHVYAYIYRGRLYEEQKKWDLALADYNKAITISPQLTNTYIIRGNFYSDQKKWDLALADYNKAIAIDPQLAQAYYNRGLLHSDQKKWDLALADYNKTIAINPQYADAYINRGNIYSQQKKWDLALTDFNKTIAINPQYALAYTNRGNLYSQQKKWDLALADFNKAIAINPQLPLAYGNRGFVYANMGNKQKAIQDFQQAAQLFQAQGNTAGYELTINVLKELQR